MTKTQSQKLAEQYVAVYNDRNPDKLTEICAPTVEWDGEDVSRNDLPTGVQMWLDAFPDITLELGTIVADKDHAAFRFTFRGTHDGDFQAIEATGEEVEVTEMILISVDDGLIDGLWYEWDELGFFEQLNALEHPVE